MSGSDDKQSTLPMPVILATVAVVALVIVAIFVFGGDGSEVTDEPTDETTTQTDPEETGEPVDENGSGGQTRDDGEATSDSGETAAPTEDDDTSLADDDDTVEPDEPSPLPADWATLSSAEKTSLNPYGCWQGTVIRADNGQCNVGGDSSAGYFLMDKRTARQHALPFDQESLKVFVAVPTNSTAVQVSEVLASYKASVAEPDAFYTFHVYNYADVVYDKSSSGALRWMAVNEPREVHEFVLNNIRYKALSFYIYQETNRDGTELPEDCIAVNISFAILSDVTAQEVVNYYVNQGPALRANIEKYTLGDAAQNEAVPKYNYDVLIRIYKGDDPAANVNDYGEADLFEGLPQVAINGCANPNLF